jgi:glycolate oxidase FAD binding subunit
MNTIINQLADTICTAAARRTPLCIRGGGSKDFYGGTPSGERLDVSGYHGIIEYEPSELVITARAGTPLSEIEDALRAKGQMLAFEPPHFGSTATLGGCVAAGLSGPRRAYTSAVRDSALGLRMLDGKGNDLRFGGRVMKNVAGFDVSRLMTGSLGTLGVILEVSLKVLPLPVAEATLQFEKNQDNTIAAVNAWAGLPLPISATAWCNGKLSLRLSGASAAVDAAIRKLGGERMDGGPAARFWVGIREHDEPYFRTPLPLWRLSIKSTTASMNLPGEQMMEWGGALRWLKSDTEAATIRAATQAAGGHATLFRGSDKNTGVFQPMSAAMLALHHRLKDTFDPMHIFNPGRLLG